MRLVEAVIWTDASSSEALVQIFTSLAETKVRENSSLFHYTLHVVTLFLANLSTISADKDCIRFNFFEDIWRSHCLHPHSWNMARTGKRKCGPTTLEQNPDNILNWTGGVGGNRFYFVLNKVMKKIHQYLLLVVTRHVDWLILFWGGGGGVRRHIRPILNPEQCKSTWLCSLAITYYMYMDC